MHVIVTVDVEEVKGDVEEEEEEDVEVEEEVEKEVEEEDDAGERTIDRGANG